MDKFLDGPSYYLIQYGEVGCFITWVDGLTPGDTIADYKKLLNTNIIGISLDSEFGPQNLSVSSVTHESSFFRMGKDNEDWADFREIMKLCWACEDKNFWSYEKVIRKYFEELATKR